jgi:hypothetical protein
MRTERPQGIAPTLDKRAYEGPLFHYRGDPHRHLLKGLHAEYLS